MKKKLDELYLRLVRAIQDPKGNKVDFTQDCYSNPYLCSIPESWENDKTRVMILGREGNGEISKTDNGSRIPFPDTDDETSIKEYIAKLQENNAGYVNGTRRANNFHIDNHAFAKTFRMFYNELNASFIWNECDKICHVDNKGYRSTNALKSKENKALHSIRDDKGAFDILVEEIKILEPTHIIFLGYWRQSLSIGKYKGKNGANKDFFPDDGFDNGKPKNIQLNGKNIKVYYFSHPQYKGEDYKKAINEVIKEISNDDEKNNILSEVEYSDKEDI